MMLTDQLHDTRQQGVVAAGGRFPFHQRWRLVTTVGLRNHLCHAATPSPLQDSYRAGFIPPKWARTTNFVSKYKRLKQLYTGDGYPETIFQLAGNKAVR